MSNFNKIIITIKETGSLIDSVTITLKRGTCYLPIIPIATLLYLDRKRITDLTPLDGTEG